MNAKTWINSGIVGLLLMVQAAFAANYQVPVGTGGAAGGLTNGYSFPASQFTTVNATNITIKDGVLMTNVVSYVAVNVYGHVFISTNLTVTNLFTSIGIASFAAAVRAESLRVTNSAVFSGTVGFTGYDIGEFMYLSPGGGLATLDNVSATELGFVDGVLGPVVGLADPNADRIYFWDDSAGAPTFLNIGSGLQISDTTLSATGGGSSGPVYQGSVYSNHVENLFGASSTVTLYGTNQSWRMLQTSNVTFAVSGLQSNLAYQVKWTNNASTITWPGTIRWWDGATMASAPALSAGSYIVDFWLNESGTNGRVVSGPVYLLAAGYKTELVTNSTTGTITSQSTQRYTNYASASITINCSTDVTANYTNAVAGNNTITLATPVIGTSGSLGLVSDGSARTLAILSPVAITWLSTNDTATATNILTTASKRSLFAWRVGMGTDGVSTNIQCWNKNQTP